MISKKTIVDNVKTLFYALIIAVIIRSIFLQPFYIPSSSMEPNLLVGDRLFVTKYSYGYSKHSFPFSPPLFKDRILSKSPKIGDVVVFKTPADNRTDYIKRLIGGPGDTIQFIDGIIYINDLELFKDLKSNNDIIFCGDNPIDVNTFEEKLNILESHAKRFFSYIVSESKILEIDESNNFSESILPVFSLFSYIKGAIKEHICEFILY